MFLAGSVRAKAVQFWEMLGKRFGKSRDPEKQQRCMTVQAWPESGCCEARVGLRIWGSEDCECILV